MDAEPLKLTYSGGTVQKVMSGGMIYASSVIRKLEAEHPDALVLHAGDAVQGSLYYSLFKGKADAAVLNSLHIDAMTIGNHEFDNGDRSLASFISMLNFPVLSANIVPHTNDPLYGKYKPYIIKNVNGSTVGIIGVTTVRKTKHSSSPDSTVSFYDESETVQKYVDELKAKGIRKIIVLSHYGYENDLLLASKVTDIDAIVGGDSHTLLGDFSSIGLQNSGVYPTVALNKDGDKVCIVQAWEYGKVVGELDITFSGDKTSACSGTPHLVTSEDGADKAVTDILAPYSVKVTAMKNVVIGRAEQDLSHTRMPDFSDPMSPKISEIAPVVAKAVYDSDTKISFSMQNAGGVRTGISAGNITLNTIYTLLPFSDTVYEIPLTGAEVKQLLEDALAGIAERGSQGGFPYSYGLRYGIDTTQSKDSRVTEIEVKNRVTGGWYPINDKETYIVATNSFNMQGKDSYKTLARVEAERHTGINTNKEVAEVFADYVRELTSGGNMLRKLSEESYPIKSFR